MTKIESVEQNVRWDPHVLSCRPPCKGQGEEEGNVAGHGDDAGDENYGVGHGGEEHGGEHTAIIGVIIDVYQLVGKLVHRLY